jgi:hypothetical protein
MVNGQNISEAKRIGCKTYWLKTYQLQNRWGTENRFSKAAVELQTGFLKPLESCM